MEEKNEHTAAHYSFDAAKMGRNVKRIRDAFSAFRDDFRIAYSFKTNASLPVISEALKLLNDSTAEVQQAASEMTEGNKVIVLEMSNLKDSTELISQSMMEMSSGTQQINDSGTALNDVASNVKTAIEKISVQINEFKVQ